MSAKPLPPRLSAEDRATFLRHECGAYCRDGQHAILVVSTKTALRDKRATRHWEALTGTTVLDVQPAHEVAGHWGCWVVRGVDDAAELFPRAMRKCDRVYLVTYREGQL